MRPVIHSIDSLDVANVKNWKPNSEQWSLGVIIVAGPEGSVAEETFQLTVCNVSYLASMVERNNIVDARHCLIVKAFDWEGIRNYLIKRIRQCQGTDWADVARQISKLAWWEFEDYH